MTRSFTAKYRLFSRLKLGNGYWRRRARRNYGARPLRRALQKYVEDPLSEALIQGGLQRPATLEIFVSTVELGFRPVVEATPVVH